MSQPSFKSFWIREYQRNLDYYIADRNPFAGWESINDAGLADQYFDAGVAAWYGNAPQKFINKFLNFAIQMVNRAQSEEKFEKDEYSKIAFPRNRGESLRIRAYAKALLKRDLPAQDLVQASLDFENKCRSYARRQWDSMVQAHMLAAARTALIGGELDRFASLLGHKWGFKWHAEEHGIYLALAKELRVSGSVRGSALTSRFRKLFDRYRDPEFKSDVFLETGMVRFEMGVIWCKHFAGREFVWRDVIDAVSE